MLYISSKRGRIEINAEVIIQRGFWVSLGSMAFYKDARVWSSIGLEIPNTNNNYKHWVDNAKKYHYKIPPIPTSMEWTQGIRVVQYRIGFLSKYTHRVDKYKHWAYNSDDIQKYCACINDDHCKWQHNVTFEDMPPLEKTLTRHSRAWKRGRC